MLKKSGHYYADWRDADGTRHRRAFPTAAEASSYSRQMREEVRSKKATRREPSASSSMRGHKAVQKTRSAHRSR
ncbi:MAG: hypothetical protein WBR14_13290, partial [Candidatus Acidiferrum sp.]